jgi:hypothetical protein
MQARFTHEQPYHLRTYKWLGDYKGMVLTLKAYKQRAIDHQLLLGSAIRFKRAKNGTPMVHIVFTGVLFHN